MNTLAAQVVDSPGLDIDPRIIRRIENADHVILSGASSAGKSTFLYALRESHPEQFSAYQPVIPANWIKEGMQDLPSKSLFHINMHRPIYGRMQSRPDYLYSNAAAPVTYEEYASEPVFKQFCKVAQGKVIALILLTPQAELVKRITERAVVEPRFEDSSKPYDNRTWSWVAKLQDMSETLLNWLRLLEDKHIEPIFVDSRDGKFVLLETVEEAKQSVTHGQFQLTEDDIKQIWTNEPFEYQRISDLVEVNASNFVQGDRTSTSQEIFKSDFTDASVLDVGCAGGYFCFEAEKAGASKVVGIELKDTRYRQALLTKRITGSNVRFEQTNLYDLDSSEKFDVVFFLNVIHHLREPMRALELLSRITAKRLYLEFPTLTDHKFLSTISFGFWNKLLNHLPLIGVSLEDDAGQTFVFSQSAIERILLRNTGAFSRIEFVQSHIPNRLIAVCHK